MHRFQARKRHHAPIARLLSAAPELQEMGRSIANCSNAMEVLLELPEGGDPYASLLEYNPCNRRLCPMCEWRRSMVWRGRLMAGLDRFFEEKPTYRPLFLTLTVRNVPLGELADQIREIHAGWNRLAGARWFPTPYWFRRTEVTTRSPMGLDSSESGGEIIQRRCAPEIGSDSARSVSACDDGAAGILPSSAHPHVHALLLVPASYFSHGYIKHTQWQAQWQMAARLDYAPVIDIRRAHAKFTAGEALYDAKAAGIEAMKYAVKATDLQKIGANVPEFAHQIRGHRLVGMSSKLRDFVPDVEPTADEMASDAACGIPSIHPGVVCVAQWDSAVSDYVLTPKA
jgi:hypothetical protein